MNVFLLLLVALLSAVGLVFIYGTGQQTGGVMAGYWARQLLWIGLGLVLMLGLAALDYEALGRLAWFLYGGSLGLLALVLLFGNRVNGAKSWLELGPINLQPAEMSKFALVVLVSWLAAERGVRFDRWRDMLRLGVVTALPMLLIALQPDYGSALVLAPISLAIAFIGGLRCRHLLWGAVLLLAAAPLFYVFLLSGNQKNRIGVFLDPVATPLLARLHVSAEREELIRQALRLRPDPAGNGWSARQSLLAVGSGGAYGQGWRQGMQTRLGFLPRPVAPTDFIFSVYAEATGFLGSGLLLAAFGALLVTGIYIAARAKDPFGRNLACAICALFFVHVFVNVGMTIGAAPVIGIPLPFLSYGGSFMLVVLGCVGVMQSVYIRRKVY